MSFSAATCFTSIPLPPGIVSFNVYLGQGDYLSPINTTPIPKDDLTIYCPYIIDNIPEGTTHLSFKDSSGTYCISFLIQNNICVTCDLGFSNYSSPSISKISCGELTGSCDNNITDYLIHWYGPDDITTLSFTTGNGSIFNYQLQHPFLTDDNSIFRESGVYTPIIENVIVNGISYSNNDGVGNILFNGNCLEPITVLPLTCNVRTNPYTTFPLSAYTNYLKFNSETQQILPFSATYKISASTKYIAWSFLGYDKPDEISLTFSGSNYTNRIGLDNFIVGDLSDFNNSNFNPSLNPKSADTSNRLTKVTCLTGLTVYDNDNIIIDITPFESNTNYELFITCLDDYNCNDCLLTQDYKIIGSSFIRNYDSICDSIEIRFDVSGCNRNDSDSDYLLYYQSLNPGIDPDSVVTSVANNNKIPYFTNKMFFQSSKCLRASLTTLPTIPVCTTSSTPTIYEKTFLTDGSGRGVFGFTGSSTFISTYYNAIFNAFSGLPPYGPDWSGSTNNTDLTYYRFYVLRFPGFLSSDSCGDGTKYIDIKLHHTSQYVTGTTISGVTTLHYLKITANTISQNIAYTDCDVDCQSSINGVVVGVNVWSTGSTTDCSNPTGNCYGTNQTFPTSGIYFLNPITEVYKYINQNTSADTRLFQSYFTTTDWSFNTYPFSGVTSTIIPSYSGSVCNYNSIGCRVARYNSFYNINYKTLYEVRLTNPSNVNDFDIWASPITNFVFSGGSTVSLAQYELAYRYSGGNVTFSSSTYIIG